MPAIRREVCSLLDDPFPETTIHPYDPSTRSGCDSCAPPGDPIQASVSGLAAGRSTQAPRSGMKATCGSRSTRGFLRSDVAGAAATLGRYLELISTRSLPTICMPRSPTARTGTTISAISGRQSLQTWKARLQEAKRSLPRLGATRLRTSRRCRPTPRRRLQRPRSEQWMINKAIHYNEWATLQSQEFAGVAAAYKAFLKSMQCHNAPCSEFLCVTPSKGEREALRCGCGQNNFNLSKKWRHGPRAPTSPGRPASSPSSTPRSAALSALLDRRATPLRPV